MYIYILLQTYILVICFLTCCSAKFHPCVNETQFGCVSCIGEPGEHWGAIGKPKLKSYAALDNLFLEVQLPHNFCNLLPKLCRIPLWFFQTVLDPIDCPWLGFDGKFFVAGNSPTAQKLYLWRIAPHMNAFSYFPPYAQRNVVVWKSRT